MSKLEAKTEEIIGIDVEEIGETDNSIIGEDVDHKDMSELEVNDHVLAKKMFLINNALEEIGFTWYHAQLFVIAGFGYSADSQLGACNDMALTYMNYQFKETFSVTVEVYYIGMLLGSLFWSTSADIIGRKLAFNASLMLSAIFSFFCGGMSSLPTYCIFLFLSCFTLGGNLAIDATVLLEYLPFKYQYLTTLLAFWWSVGPTFLTLIAWAFIPKYHCDSMDDCPSEKNRGWRYVWYSNSGIVLFFALCRLFAFKLDESPKFLVSNRRDEEAVEILQNIAKKYNRTCSLTLEDLTACGEVKLMQDFNEKKSFMIYIQKMGHNMKQLFASKKMGYNTSLLFFSWLLLGISYPLYSDFLPVYLATRGANISPATTDGVYRFNTISNFVSIFGPIIAGFLCLIPRVGRRGTLAIGGLSSMCLLFGYTQITNEAGNLAFSCTSYMAIYIYYGCLYAYTPEVLPASCRATGSGLAMCLTRLSALMVPIIAYYGDTSSTVPIWICGACIGVLGVVALFFPFEPMKQRSV